MPEPAGGGEEKGPQDRGRNQEDQRRANLSLREN